MSDNEFAPGEELHDPNVPAEPEGKDKWLFLEDEAGVEAR